MKKVAIFMLLSMLLLTGLSFGQTVSKLTVLKSNTTGKDSDTLANAGTKNQSVKIEGYFDSVSIQTNLTKLSGTAAGKVYLLGSLDGVNFVKDDSLTVANVTTQSKIFTSNPSKYLHYRISFVGTGTQSVKFNSLAVYRKR